MTICCRRPMRKTSWWVRAPPLTNLLRAPCWGRPPFCNKHSSAASHTVPTTDDAMLQPTPARPPRSTQPVRAFARSDGANDLTEPPALGGRLRRCAAGSGSSSGSGCSCIFSTCFSSSITRASLS